MENKNNKKSSKKFGKEGFYVSLFICLCIVATIASITTKNKKVIKNNKPKDKTAIETKTKKKEVTLNNSEEQKDRVYENALEVKNSKQNKNNNEVNNNEVNKKSNDEVKVSTKINTNMVKPVEGTIARAYSEVPVFWESTKTERPNYGVDIKAPIGTKVVATMDGVVESVGDNEQSFGKQVVINHKNGLKTIYANLDENIIVKKGQNVKQGEQLGKVGNTTLRSYAEKYGSNLHFEMLKNNEHIDPEKYVKYDK